ncbi:hypothetical protein BX600DRAFT_510481 [Xylariales sp. PMI_506]|nr:hypothetical protein BX600DRAFT_510481 [Xylariales sp. PMI_506]
MEISLERLSPNVIAQRDTITSLQRDLGKLNRSAIASMVKSKQRFGSLHDLKCDLKSLLQHSRNCEASDSRDRVYAFLGLASEGYGIIPDYSDGNTIKDILIETAKGIVRVDKSLDILQYVHCNREKLGHSLPSWVPDWTSPEIETYFNEWCTSDETHQFNASNGLTFEVGFGSSVGDDCHDDLKV